MPKDGKIDKKDKSKSAQKIAKDMERWAKSMNKSIKSEKEAKSSVIVDPSAAATAVAVPIAPVSSNSVEDLAFNMMLQRGQASRATATVAATNQQQKQQQAAQPERSEPSAETATSEDANEDESVHTDWVKLACLLCKRQFPSKEKLLKHNQMSDLHRQNLEQLRQSSQPEEPTNEYGQSVGGGAGGYRDRAKERRDKYGEDDQMQVRASKLKQKYLKALNKAAPKPPPEPERKVGADNLGNKMLQKMGWKEGLGLGKANQGRTNIVEAERRNATAGLGTKGPDLDPNDTYKDCVKKTLFHRYQDRDEDD